jgi:hypothetical protein
MDVAKHSRERRKASGETAPLERMRDFSAPKRSAAAYLQLLKAANDAITDTVVAEG